MGLRGSEVRKKYAAIGFTEKAYVNVIEWRFDTLWSERNMELGSRSCRSESIFKVCEVHNW